MLIDKDRDSSVPSLHLPALQTEPHLFRELGWFLFVTGTTDPGWCECNPPFVAGLHRCDGLGFSYQFCSWSQAWVVQTLKKISVRLNKLCVTPKKFPVTVVTLVDEVRVYCQIWPPWAPCSTCSLPMPWACVEGTHGWGALCPHWTHHGGFYFRGPSSSLTEFEPCNLSTPQSSGLCAKFAS